MAPQCGRPTPHIGPRMSQQQLLQAAPQTQAEFDVALDDAFKCIRHLEQELQKAAFNSRQRIQDQETSFKHSQYGDLLCCLFSLLEKESPASKNEPQCSSGTVAAVFPVSNGTPYIFQDFELQRLQYASRHPSRQRTSQASDHLDRE